MTTAVEDVALAAGEQRRLDEVDDAALDGPGAPPRRRHRLGQRGEPGVDPVGDRRARDAARQHSET